MVITILIILLILYVIKIPADSLQLEKVEFNTGDLILFRSLTGFNTIKMLSPITHVGMIVMIDGYPFIFECVNKSENKPRLVDAYDRIKRSKSIVYYRKIKDQLVNVRQLNRFVNYSLDNMMYTKNMVSDFVSKAFNIGIINNDLNCCELVYICLHLIGICSYNNKGLIHPIWFMTKKLNHFKMREIKWKY